MKLYFVRHGENQANIDRVLSYKVVDHPLTPKGVEQAHNVGNWLLDHQIARVYSSPLRRAAQTGEIIGERLGLAEKVRIIEELREINVGILDGLSGELYWQMHDDVIARWRAGDETAAFEEGEHHLTLRTRLQHSIDQILAESIDLATGQNVVVVAHAGLLNLGLPWLCNNLAERKTLRDHIFNTAVIVVDATPEYLTCVHWNLNAHLPHDEEGKLL